MAEPALFGAPSENAPGCHEYMIPVTIGSTSSAATWVGYGVTLTRPTSTTMTLTFPKAYAQLLGFEQGRQPAASSSQVAWIITTNHLATDGTITLTSVASGSATAPANTDVYYLRFVMSADILVSRFTGSVT